MKPDSLREFPSRSVSPGGGDRGNGGISERLRLVELDVREIKTDMKHVATRAWVLGGLLGGMGIAAGIAATIFRLLSQP